MQCFLSSVCTAFIRLVYSCAHIFAVHMQEHFCSEFIMLCVLHVITFFAFIHAGAFFALHAFYLCTAYLSIFSCYFPLTYLFSNIWCTAVLVLCVLHSSECHTTCAHILHYMHPICALHLRPFCALLESHTLCALQYVLILNSCFIIEIKFFIK